VVVCPRCKAELDDSVTQCYVCGYEFDSEEETEWVLLGTIEDKLSADFAQEALKSYDIPAVIISRSGFFGNVGLSLNPFYKPGAATFEVRVPKTHEEAAVDILDMTLGEKWQREKE
jgi:hypothetical protein